jgi:hypothetical protein
MKAPIAQAAPEAASAPDCAFFSRGLEIAESILENSDFGWVEI